MIECCKALRDRFEPSSYGKGIRSVQFVNLENHKTYSAYVYKKSTKDRGLMMNFCPFCGREIIPDHLREQAGMDNPTEKEVGNEA